MTGIMVVKLSLLVKLDLSLAVNNFRLIPRRCANFVRLRTMNDFMPDKIKKYIGA